MDRGNNEGGAVELGPLMAADGSPAGGAKVWLDGVVMLETDTPLYPVRAKELKIGRNSPGLSTSAPAFTGEIFSVHPRAAAPQ